MYRQNDCNTILYNPPFDGSIHRGRFHNFISFFIKKKRCCFGSFCVGTSGGFGPNGGLGSKEVPRKFEEMLKEIYIFLHKMVK